ncbi:hypothetical protein BBP40_006017 [Aspergillus hancockii]|nr:hypothetical protein BBP40_006017 [Aspergillus hancockii]
MSPNEFLPPSFHRLTDSQPLLSPDLNKLAASKLKVTLTDESKPVPVANAPELATRKISTDHMVRARQTASSGWEAPEIIPHGPLILQPHIGGMMESCAYYILNITVHRMLASAVRISLPGFEPEQLHELIRKFWVLDEPKWLTRDHAGSSLYIRPTLIGVDDSLGFQALQEALLFIIISYRPRPMPSTTPAVSAGQGMRLLASEGDTVRAWRGAKRKGCDQLLWLFGPGGQVTEAGSTNFFVIWRTTEGKLQLVTPRLDEYTILPGVTRQSVFDLARARLSIDSTQRMGAEAAETLECNFTIHDIAAAADQIDWSHHSQLGQRPSSCPLAESNTESGNLSSGRLHLRIFLCSKNGWLI